MRARGVVIPDAHVPHHNPWAIEALMKFLEAHHFDFLDQVGDWMNTGQFGRHAKKRDRLQAFLHDVHVGRDLFKNLVLAAKSKNQNCKVAFHRGNHEKWWFSHIYEDNPELAGFAKDLYEELGLYDMGAMIATSYAVGGEAFPSIVRYEPNDKGVLKRVLRSQRDKIRSYGLTTCHGFFHGKYAPARHVERMGLLGPIFFGHIHRVGRMANEAWGEPNEAFACGHLVHDFLGYANRPTGDQMGFGVWTWDGQDFHGHVIAIRWDGRTAAFELNGERYEATKRNSFIQI